MACELCDGPGGTVLWRDERLRIVRVDDSDYRAFCRVVWQNHVRELTDLPATDADHLFKAVLATERVLRELVNPLKINVASLGNVTPHLHWHVIPRFAGDRHFPRPVWAEAIRTAEESAASQRQAEGVSDEALKHKLAELLGSTLRDV
jgi:diadenosine tetraphosphate (Ap4A) HIT family hydrolase